MGIKQVQFHHLYKPVFFKNRNSLKKYILQLLKREGKKVGHINYILCDDSYLLKLNWEHLNHNNYTDIITFELSNKGLPLVAEIYISIERVRENAKTFKTTFTRELHRVLFHGILHLVGYNDKTPRQASKMRQLEEKYLNNWFHVKQPLKY